MATPPGHRDPDGTRIRPTSTSHLEISRTRAGPDRLWGSSHLHGRPVHSTTPGGPIEEGPVPHAQDPTTPLPAARPGPRQPGQGWDRGGTGQFHLTWSGGCGHARPITSASCSSPQDAELLSDLGSTRTRIARWTLSDRALFLVVIDGKETVVSAASRPSDGSLELSVPAIRRYAMIRVDGRRLRLGEN